MKDLADGTDGGCCVFELVVADTENDTLALCLVVDVECVLPVWREPRVQGFLESVVEWPGWVLCDGQVVC